MERHAIEHPGTPLFVRPVYDGASWVPESIDFAILVEGRLRCERSAISTLLTTAEPWAAAGSGHAG